MVIGFKDKMAADKQLDLEEFRIIKAECTIKIAKPVVKLTAQTDPNRGIDHSLKEGIHKLSELAVLCKNGAIREKRHIIGLCFPDILMFDGFQYRTTHINEAVRLIYFIDNELKDKKMGQASNVRTCPIM